MIDGVLIVDAIDHIIDMSRRVYEGDETEHHRKQCRCLSSSSGPRMIVKDTGNSTVASYVNLACDACDTPWIRKP